jgi:hypothetical protein
LASGVSRFSHRWTSLWARVGRSEVSGIDVTLVVTHP